MLIGQYASETNRDFEHYTTFFRRTCSSPSACTLQASARSPGMCHRYFTFKTGLQQGFDVWDTSAMPPGMTDNDRRVTSERLTDVALELLAKPENVARAAPLLRVVPLLRSAPAVRAARGRARPSRARRARRSRGTRAVRRGGVVHGSAGRAVARLRDVAAVGRRHRDRAHRGSRRGVRRAQSRGTRPRAVGAARPRAAHRLRARGEAEARHGRSARTSISRRRSSSCSAAPLPSDRSLRGTSLVADVVRARRHGARRARRVHRHAGGAVQRDASRADHRAARPARS